MNSNLHLGDVVLFKQGLYEIVQVDEKSETNRYKLLLLACIDSSKLTSLEKFIYVSDSNTLEIVSVNKPKFLQGDRVKYKGEFAIVRFVMVEGSRYEYQIGIQSGSRISKYDYITWVNEFELSK
ncbi:MAG: hypothetical protein PVJ09_00310 [Candidatus Woesebacteria bacterium]|jgi:hypothetical protein